MPTGAGSGGTSAVFWEPLGRRPPREGAAGTPGAEGSPPNRLAAAAAHTQHCALTPHHIGRQWVTPSGWCSYICPGPQGLMCYTCTTLLCQRCRRFRLGEAGHVLHMPRGARCAPPAAAVRGAMGFLNLMPMALAGWAGVTLLTAASTACLASWPAFAAACWMPLGVGRLSPCAHEVPMCFFQCKDTCSKALCAPLHTDVVGKAMIMNLH